MDFTPVSFLLIKINGGLELVEFHTVKIEGHFHG